MPHNITEVSEYTAAVPVPSGTDDHHNFAELLEAAFKPLANRTKFLRARSDTATDAALRSQPNTFTKPNAFTDGITANAASLGLASAASLSSGITTVTSLTSSGPIVGKLITGTGLGISGNASVGGTLSANTLSITNFNATNITSTHVRANESLVLGSGVDISYADEVLVWKSIPLASAIVASGSPTFNGVFWRPAADAYGAILYFPLIAPTGARIRTIQAYFMSADEAKTNRITLYRVQAPWDDATTPTSSFTQSPVASVESWGNSTANLYRSDLDAESHFIDNSATDYSVYISLAATQNNRLYGLRYQMVDPGARNK